MTTQPLITDAHRARINEDGFFLLENVFSAEDMDRLAGAIEQQQRRHAEALAASGETVGISNAKIITFTDHLAENDEEIMAFCKRPELIDITTPFLGPDFDLYWNQSVYKMPEGFKEFPWHQDDGYTAVTPSPYLTLWVALNDATVENGCIWVLPGSHKRGLLPHEQTPLGLACHSATDPDQGIPVPVSKGSIAVFWSLTVHKSGPNISNGVRKGYIIQYSQAGLRFAASGDLVQGLEGISRG
jgi:ectoine hydroxylase-related dioxygenase (phytanoyl-CoA dioxygenase family)